VDHTISASVLLNLKKGKKLEKALLGVNFTNILRAAFLYQSSLHSFHVLTICVCKFWQKDFGAKAAHKMLVKLTPD
jgi:hypothetical protein